jgi:hypothetical protein
MPNLNHLNSALPAEIVGGFSPLFLSPDAAFRALGIGRTKGWELIRDGHLVARKIGARTVVEAESVRRFAAALPHAGKSAP